ncbi:DMT family transporter [Pelagibius sp. Alg239-R121]|uniref:DMT family transporter n=1 Tax=Pelagibius sp. Alg239-R121 TaxID=2993448 RepID=UPI0024A6C81B|nr:DMT family transporter [Pelagibius sp. Alg239-R121]
MPSDLSKTASPADQAAIPPVPRNNVLQGIGWMLVTGFLFVAVTGIVRHLGSDMPAIEAAFIRYALGLLLILPFLFKLTRQRIEPDVMKLYAARGLVHGIAVMLWFFAMARIPIAEVTAIGYTAPIYVTIGAAFFLGEKLQVRRVVAIMVGLTGSLVILRPGFQEINAGQLAQVVAAPLFAASFILAKKLTDRADPAIIVGMLSVFCTIVLLPGAILQWRDPTLEEVLWLALTAVFATTGHYTLTKAFRAAPITVTQPIAFLQLLWAALLGMAVFDEALDPFVFLGGAIVIGAATYISHRETLAARRRKQLEAETPSA